MITKSELEKMVDEAAHECAGWKYIPASSFSDSIKRSLFKSEQDFKSGASFMHGILMPEVESIREDLGFWKKEALLHSDAREQFKQELSEAKARIDELEKDSVQDESKWTYWRNRSGEMTDAWREQRDLVDTLTAKVKRYEEVIKCCDSDYWFMINLIEHYSSDKDQALKDCLERMKFRKPMFKAALNETSEVEK